MEEDKSQLLFSGNLNISYGQFYVDVDDENYLDPGLAFENQENGICGAAQNGKLFLVAGIQDGFAKVKVELHQSEPVIDNMYEDIVEASFKAESKPILLCEWAHQTTHILEIPLENYQVRYSITGMDKDYGEDGDYEAPIPDQNYLLQFWPSNSLGDKVVKLTSKSATYWHKEWGNLK